MPSTSSGRIVKSRKGKASTPHQKNHRWESFTAKISKLHSLDPLRRVRRHDLEAEDLKSTTSYFRNGLEKWTDLNISKGFMSFRREVLPLCDSLAQIIHCQGKIMDILATYISAQEKESLEPLLDLLTALAHDLGTRFEKFYARSLTLIVEIAGRPQDAAVIEWSFACLAFLFKYLSKLLTPDIRPTYDALASLLGKTRHPQHIVRFAAEALSFLVKKAAAPAHRETALVELIEHARKDLEGARGTRQYELYFHGLMTMFAESIKGQGNGVHTNGPDIIKALIASVPNEDITSLETQRWSDAVNGILVSLAHYTVPETFGPVLKAVCELGQNELQSSDPRNVLYIRLLGTMAGVRKGVRIEDWAALLDCVRERFNCLAGHQGLLDDVDSSIIWNDVLINLAVVYQYAPMDTIISSVQHLIKGMTKEPLMQWFIPFCSYFADLDARRFQSLLLKDFQKFVVTHWSEGSNENLLCVFLPRMVAAGGLPSLSKTDGFLLPQSWQDQIVSKFERLEISPFPEQGSSSTWDKDPKTWRDQCLPKYSALLQLLNCTAVRPSTNAPIAEILLKKLKLALRPSESLATEDARFIVTQGFSSYLRMSKASLQIDTSLSPLLKAAAPRYGRLVGFLESMLEYEVQIKERQSSESRGSGSSSPEKEEDPLLKCLQENLSSPSHAIRSASLKLLAHLEVAPDQLDMLAAMQQIEETPLDLQNVRMIGVHLRKLAATYPQLSESWLRHAVPEYLFGMMTVGLTPVWDSAVEALKEIGQTPSGEQEVCDTAFKWLATSSFRRNGPTKQQVISSNYGLTDFECSNLNRLLKQADETRKVLDEHTDIMLRAFDEEQEPSPTLPSNARSQALRVLDAVPNLAEKRSRKLVPFFLIWASDNLDESNNADDQTNSSSAASWSLADRKALLGVLAQFINPKVLYQSDKVYESLLNLLANGDAGVQKSALKAILAWKQDGVQPYKENLEYLLDEARFKNELTVLFQGEIGIKPEHRSELMPVLLRLLYGRTISKKGIASGRHGLYATRLAVLRQLDPEDLGSFLQIALGALQDVKVIENTSIKEDIFQQDILPARKQVGLMNMMEAMVNELGTHVMPYTEKVLNAVLYCLISAGRKLNASADTGDEPDEEDESQTSLARVARTTALKCLVILLQNAPDFDWALYEQVIIKEIVSPRIENLPIETAQGISGILRLLSMLSTTPKTAVFFTADLRIVPKLTECITIEKAKDEVKVFCLKTIRNLISLAEETTEVSDSSRIIKEQLLEPNIEQLLNRIGRLLTSSGLLHKDLLAACVDTVVELSPAVQQSGNAAELLRISVHLLGQPSGRVNPKIKGRVLLIMQKFLELDDLESEPELRSSVYSAISALFSFFRDRPNRHALAEVLKTFARGDSRMLEVAAICTELNADKSGRIDEPDFERRLRAFITISQTAEEPYTHKEWEPLLHNMLFYIKDDSEYGILASNSADGICRFVDTAANAQGPAAEQFVLMLNDVVLPAIYSSAKEPSETVRREFIRVLSYIVSHMPSWQPVRDMVQLESESDGPDPDATFFGNVLSPAASKQMRALQHLSKVNHHTPIGSRNTAHYLIPLLEHFIFGREEGSDDHGVGAQATTTIADIAVSLDWPQYRAILRRYIGYVDSRPEAQKQLIRLLQKFVETLASAISRKQQDAMDVDGSPLTVLHALTKSIPPQDKVSEDITAHFLPPLTEYIHHKDEATVSSRVPVAIVIVKLLKLLPAELSNLKLPPVLTDICHILRSKAWESREMARDTLAKISTLLGPSSFGFVLNELRGALTKGYQLHILSYTMHSILVAVTPQYEPGDLDYCLNDIVAVIMDDIFGVTGQEKDAEEYTNKMKEIKSSKSQDSMELIARTTSISHLVDLVRPLQALLLEKLDLRMVRKLDDLLTRIASGLLGNDAAESRDTLVFCYEVIQSVYNSEKPEAEIKIDPRIRRYLVQRGAKKSGERGSTTKYTYKLIRFAVDILRSVLKKHDSLRNAGNIAGFIPILGDAVVSGEEEVRIATYKLLTVLVKVPFKTDDWLQLYKVAAKEGTKSISTSTSTNTDLAQTALKLMSVILRDRRDVLVKDAAVDMLLGKVKDDLTEPQYRHVTFNFLRCVLDRKVETATVYDILDYVGTVMITNDDKDTRDLARGAFFQFLRDYPQRKNRWAKQLSFVVANLKYEREGGRLSVMEVIHLLLLKSSNEFVQEVASTCFIPLVFVLANDDSENCRLAAGELVKEIFQKADKEHISKFLLLLRSWLEQDDNPAVLKLGIQTFGFYFQARELLSTSTKDFKLLLDAIANALNDGSPASSDEEDLMKTALQVHTMLIERYPSVALARKDIWQAVRNPLSHPSSSVKLSAVRVLLAYLTDFSEVSKGALVEQTDGSHGLTLTKGDIQELAILAMGILSSTVISRWRRRSTRKQANGIPARDVDGPYQALETESDETLLAEGTKVLLMLGQSLEVAVTREASDLGGEPEDAEEEDDDDNDDEEEEEEEWGGVDTAATEAALPAVTLQTLFTWLSDLIVTETRPRSTALLPKVATMELLSALGASLPQESLEPCLNILLTPLHHLTDPSIPIPFSAEDLFKTRYEALKTKAEEVMDFLQRKMGTESYTRELLRVRDSVKRRREGRSRKRKIEAVSQPEKWGKWKQGKLDKKVKRRKERSVQNRSRRRGY